MPGQYRTEHVAEVPKRWKVRTVAKGTHLVRVAFPPGKRKKGSGKLIEILHPVNENPCAMPQERGPRPVRPAGGPVPRGTAQNPDQLQAAGELSREFHGTDPRQVITMQETDVTRRTYTALGDLVQLWIRNVGGDYRTSKISFTGDRVKVASAPNGAQLYLIGGNQNIDSHLGTFGGDVSKDFVELGQAIYISYATRKKMDDLKWTEYFHHLGEETHEPPLAFYNRLQRRIFLVGGRYRVESPGIIN